MPDDAVTLSAPIRAALLDAARGALLERLRRPRSVAGPYDAGEAAVAPIDPPPPSEELARPAGCFVSLHERGTHRLRGCVGRLDPDMPLWDCVRVTARDVLNDPRFDSTLPVTLADAPELEIEISVLSPPRRAPSPLEFHPLVEGIYLVIGSRAGFFLPQVARETGWPREHLLGRLCTEKLGMPADAWQLPEASLFTFRVEVIGPEPLLPSPV